MTKETGFYAVHKCPQCGYESSVTDVCRSCQRNMYPTGEEENYEDKRRPLGGDKKEFELAEMWANLTYAGDVLEGREVPQWAKDVLVNVFHVDLTMFEREGK